MGRLLLLAIFILFLPLVVAAQGASANQNASPNDGPFGPHTPRNNDSLSNSAQEISLPPDMRARMAIERAEGEHKKILKDVEQLGELSSEVSKGYAARGSLSSEELKKVATIEKLAKRILSHAGGKEVEDVKPTQVAQISLADAINQMSVAVTKIQKNMTEETRFVVSATVIADSNEVINLAQFIRRSQKQGD